MFLMQITNDQLIFDYTVNNETDVYLVFELDILIVQFNLYSFFPLTTTHINNKDSVTNQENAKMLS